MRKRGLCRRPVSVRPSLTLVYCIHTAQDIVRLLCEPGSSTILVFWPPAPVPNSEGKPFTGAQNIILGYRKLLQVCLAVAKPGPEGLNILKNLQVPKRVTCV